MNCSSSDLMRFGYSVPVPCSVSLTDGDSENSLKIIKVLRVLPGKRLTAVALHEGKEVVAKLFFHPQTWKRNLQRDLKGIGEFQSHNLKTPEIIGQFSIKGAGGVILIEYLETGVSLADYFCKPLSIDTDFVLSKIFAMICRCHNVGLKQGDMHLGNYMLYKDDLYLIDGGDVEKLSRSLPDEHRVQNIADFISQFPVSYDHQIDTMLNYYRVDYLGLNSDDLDKVTPLVHALRKQRLSHIEKKVFRSTTANRKVHTVSFRYVHDRSFQIDYMNDFLKDPDACIIDQQLLKDGDTTTVAETKFGDWLVVIKRYNIVSLGQGLKRLVLESRAQRCWRNASTLRLLGICTPRPLVFLEERRLWLFCRRAYFLTEKIAANNLLQQLEDPAETIDEKRLVAALQTFFEAMFTYQISHGDMKATNFIFKDSKLYVLDLDGMKRHRFKWWANRRFLSDVKRFERNWIGSPYESVFAPLIKQLYVKGQEHSHG